MHNTRFGTNVTYRPA